MRSHKLAELALAPHVQADEFPPMLVAAHIVVPPAKISRLHRPHTCVAHDEHEVVRDCPVPRAQVMTRRLDPAARECMQMPVLLRREFLPASLVARQDFAARHLPFADVLFVGGEIQDRKECLHFMANAAVLRLPAANAFAVLLAPEEIRPPFLLTNQSDLYVPDIWIRCRRI